MPFNISAISVRRGRISPPIGRPTSPVGFAGGVARGRGNGTAICHRGSRPLTKETRKNRDWDKPTTSEPRMAPVVEPIPPTMTAANIVRRRVAPMLGASVPMDTPSTDPLRDARTPARIHVIQYTTRVFTPLTRARSRLSAVARIAFPSFVYFRRTTVAVVADAATAIGTRSRIGFVLTAPPKKTQLSGYRIP